MPPRKERRELRPLPAEGFVRLDQILSVIPISANSWWAGVRSGRFPPGIKFGPRTTVWRVEHIRALIESFNGRSWNEKLPAKVARRKKSSY